MRINFEVSVFESNCQVSKYTIRSGLSIRINILCRIKLHQKWYQRRPDSVPLELK